jgi:hypothetical protein
VEAKERIQELHPLADLPLHRVFPMWALCIKRCAKNRGPKKVSPSEKRKIEAERLNKAGQDLGMNNVTEPLLSKDDADEEIAPVDESEDPYLSLGFGMVAYFNMLKALILMFSVFTLLAIPMISIYVGYDGQSSGNNYSKSKFSLGNMGFSESICKHIFIGIEGNYEFTCRTGTIDKIEYTGILPAAEPTVFEKYMGFCADPTDKVTPNSLHPEVAACQGAIQGDFIAEYINKNCAGSATCQSPISVKDMLVPQANAPAGTPSSCYADDSIVYLQYKCSQSNEILNTKRDQGLFVSCVGILISLLFLTCMYYLSKVAAIEFKQWDVGTVTAGDFTVEYQIPKKVWTKFEDQHTDKSKAEGTYFEDYLKREFERIVGQQDSVLYPNLTGDQKPEIKIANITFAFKNAKLIKLLRARGKCVADGQFRKLPEVDAKINELKDKEIQTITKPVTAFITFDSQDGYERACEFKGKENCNGSITSFDDHEFDGEPLIFEEAPEPTNIIWENRQISYKQQMIWTAIVSAIIVFLLFLAFMAFFELKKQTIANYQKYPPTTNCDDLDNIFGLTKDGVSTGKKVENDVNFIKNAEADKKLISNFGTGTGVYQCYCTALQKEIGQVKMFSNPVCKMFSDDFFGGKALSQVVSISIVVINLVLRAIMLILIELIGYHTESGKTAAIMTSIFVVQFFNTAILLILTNANTADAGLGFLPFKGMYPDLNFEWYNDIGSSFLTTMFTAAVFPIIEFCIAFGMKTAFKFLDRGCKLSGDTTKKNTIQAYINLYSGPEYAMHFKYSGMMNMLFVAFMYGLAIPMLFPISLIAFTILYTMEKLTLTYFFRKPPMFDEKLNDSAISKMKWAPIFMMFFGYWCLSNVQIFTKDSYPIISTLTPVKTGHTMWGFGINQALPLVMVGIFLGVLIFFNDLALTVLNKFGIMMPEDEDEVDEGLGSYWECLDEHDRKVWYLDETHMRKNLGLITLDDDSLEKLKSGPIGKRTIADTPNYEIVTNAKYAEQFQYCPIDFRDSPEEKETSDMVLKIMNLAYTPEEEIAKFNFQGSRSKKRSNNKDTSIQ